MLKTRLPFKIEAAANAVADNKYTTIIFGTIYSNISILSIKILDNKTSVY